MVIVVREINVYVNRNRMMLKAIETALVKNHYTQVSEKLSLIHSVSLIQPVDCQLVHFMNMCQSLVSRAWKTGLWNHSIMAITGKILTFLFV